MLADLSTMDRTLCNNLMFLKTYDGNAEDLCLSFAITKSEFGCNEEMALIPGGKNKDVTDLNKHHYIELVAKHYVCDQVKEQSEAFRRGLWDVIDRQWLRIFNEPELQVVISGATDGSVDVEDIKANTKYVGGYTIFDRNVHNFWKVVSSFNERQRADLLKFVTSCERPPPLGFASMNPPFTIQRVQINKDEEKLPTASTCFNILKLPTYSSAKVMKTKLLYSIESRSGFELT
jgi:ubiquitin-protein ligase E3 C